MARDVRPPITREGIDRGLLDVDAAGMTLRNFLLIDSVVLDIAGIAALFAGEVALGVTLLAVAAAAFGASVRVGRGPATT